MSKDFAQRLRTLRKESGNTQAKLWQILHYGCTTIANYESDRNEPSYEDLIVIADYFGVSLDYLLGRTEDRKNDLAELMYCCEEISLAKVLRMIEVYRK